MQTARSFHVKSRWKSGWQNADEKCTRRKCGRTRVVRLLASWIRGIIPSTVYTVYFYDPFIFFHRQTKSALFSLENYHLVMSRSINTFFFFFSIKKFLPQNKIDSSITFFFFQRHRVIFLLVKNVNFWYFFFISNSLQKSNEKNTLKSR